jgi:D-lactate dehydrogenase
MGLMEHSDFDIFFYEAFEEEKTSIQSFLPDSIVAGFTTDTIQETNHKEPPAKIISLRTQSVIPREWSDKMDALLSRSAGYDHLTAYRQSTDTSVAMGYLPLYCVRAVAEHAMLLWMSLLRKLPQQTEQFETFNRDGITGVETLGKNLLVVGVGNIGSEIIRIGQSLGMNAYGVDLERKHDFVDYVDYENKKSDADIIVCAMNLTDDNRGYFNEQRLSGIKPSTLFINISRGELSPPGVLLKRLKSGKLGGVGLDTYDQESELAVTLRSDEPSQNPIVNSIIELAKLPNAICTPHNAFNTHEAVVRKSEQSIQQTENFLKTGSFIWSVLDVN